jgi:hypothetical protein
MQMKRSKLSPFMDRKMTFPFINCIEKKLKRNTVSRCLVQLTLLIVLNCLFLLVKIITVSITMDNLGIGGDRTGARAGHMHARTEQKNVSLHVASAFLPVAFKGNTWLSDEIGSASKLKTNCSLLL